MTEQELELAEVSHAASSNLVAFLIFIVGATLGAGILGCALGVLWALSQL